MAQLRKIDTDIDIIIKHGYRQIYGSIKRYGLTYVGILKYDLRYIPYLSDTRRSGFLEDLLGCSRGTWEVGSVMGLIGLLLGSFRAY